MPDSADAAARVTSKFFGGDVGVSVGFLDHVGFDFVEPGEEKLGVAGGEQDALLDEFVAVFEGVFGGRHIAGAEQDGDGGFVMSGLRCGVFFVFRVGAHFAHVWRRIGNLGVIKARFFEEDVDDAAGLGEFFLELAEGFVAEIKSDGPDDEVGGHFAFGEAFDGYIFVESFVVECGVPEKPGGQRHADDEGESGDAAGAARLGLIVHDK